jgi:hypothetical protein
MVVLYIKPRKFPKREVRAANEIMEDELNFFVTSLQRYKGYPKVRDLQKILGPRLNLIRINTILRYLVKSKSLEIDLDGNIIWFRQEKTDRHLSFMEAANISKEVLQHFSIEDKDDTEPNDNY